MPVFDHGSGDVHARPATQPGAVAEVEILDIGRPIGFVHAAERAQLLPWVPTEKLRFVRITPSEISGRRFQFGPEPDHGAYPS